MSRTDKQPEEPADERTEPRADEQTDKRTEKHSDKRPDQLTLDGVVSYLVCSVMVRLIVAGVAIVGFQFLPWGTILQHTSGFQQGAEVNRQFEQVAEALQSGRASGEGFDPYLGPTGVTSSPPYRPPTTQRGRSGEEGVLAGLKRKLGFGDGPVQAPEWAPIFPGAVEKGTIVQSTPEGEKRIISAAVSATGPSIANYYERAFTRMGYTFTNEQNGSGNTYIAESPDGLRRVTVAISARGARSTLALTHLERLTAAAEPAAAAPAGK